MKKFVALCCAAFCALLVPAGPAARANPVLLTVPGTSNPWLAGMPDGSPASITDFAPGQSPVLVTGLTLSPGLILEFSATGLVFNFDVPPDMRSGPDGHLVNNQPDFFFHKTGAENGIANVTAPINSLMGVFLDGNRPDSSAAPAALDFSVGNGLNYTSLSPGLKQPFFIGDGLANGVTQQQVVVPMGATRLFLGTMDGFQWENNVGSFQVQVRVPGTQPPDPPEPPDPNVVPEPGSLLLGCVGAGLSAFLLRRRTARNRR
jgi:hypothetical protein